MPAAVGAPVYVVAALQCAVPRVGLSALDLLPPSPSLIDQRTASPGVNRSSPSYAADLDALRASRTRDTIVARVMRDRIMDKPADSTPSSGDAISSKLGG